MSNALIIRHLDTVASNPVERSQGATIQVLLGPDDDLPHFFMRRFTIQPKGHIPAHSHPDIEHVQLVLEGEMVIGHGDQERCVKAGDCIFIPAGLGHWYENRGPVPVRFLCMVPRTDSYRTDWIEPLPAC